MHKIFTTISNKFNMIKIKCTSRLVNKLVLLFTSIIVLIVVSLTFVSYSIIQNQSIKNSVNESSDNLRLVNKNFENYLNDIEQLALPGLKYQKVLNSLQSEADDFSAQAYLEDYLRGLYYSRSDVQGIFLYLIPQNKYYYILRSETDVKVRVILDTKIKNTQWYESAVKSEREGLVEPLSMKDEIGYPIDIKKCFMAYHRSIINISTRTPQAVISFYLNSDLRDEILSDVSVNDGEHLILTDSNISAFYADNYNFFYEAKKNNPLSENKYTKSILPITTYIDQEKYLAISNISDKYNSLLLKYIPYDLINKAAKTNRNASYIIGLIFLLFSVTIVVFTSSAITKPLNRLSKKMDQFSKGNFNVEADVCGRDEIAHISKQFNLMAKNTDELITEKYKMKLIEKSSILKALEAEINPHFLYNALQAISTRALKCEEYSISSMVDALASTFRYSIKGGDVVTINEEIKHVKNYLVIQEARFGERLKVIYDIEEDALEVKIPKLAIQTLVENSIKHVLETISKTLCIYIRAKVLEDIVLISVRDDGLGISKQKLEAVLGYLKENWEGGENEHIGLRNLNTRLNLIFGSESNILIKTDNTGTEINFIVPKGGCINAKCSDC